MDPTDRAPEPVSPRPPSRSTAAVGSHETRDRILDEAEALFAGKGFAGTSVRDIAGQVGVTPASLYNHFSGKGALYEAVLERGVRPLLDVMRQASGSEHREDTPGQLIEAVMAHLATRPHLPRLIQHEVVTGGEYLASLAKDWVRPLLEEGLLELEREQRSVWDREEYPLAIAGWIHLVLGHFALAPLMREVFGEDPLSDVGIARQTRFLRKLSAILVDAGGAEELEDPAAGPGAGESP